MSIYDPRNRKEIFYRGILDGDHSLPGPQTREELYLKAIADAMPIVVTDTQVVQGRGSSTDDVMSQKATTDAIDAVREIVGNEYLAYTRTGYGYIQNDGVIYYTTSPESYNHMMKIDGADALRIRHIHAYLGNSAFENAIGCKDSGGVPIAYGKFTSDNAAQWVDIDVPEETTEIFIFNRYSVLTDPYMYITTSDGLIYKVIENSRDIETLEEIRYNDVIDKPIAFSGKKLQFFGDSITYGYLTGGYQATNQYPKVFSTHVGAAAYKNEGVSGSMFATVAGYDQILTTIQANLDNTYDVVFVAGGINDWQLGVDEDDLTSAVDAVCDYLKDNFSGTVIFITPINESGKTPTNTPAQTLQSVRNIITRKAIEYGYSVVQGYKFPFPTVDDDSDYKTLMFQDNLHPTELGYKTYAKALANAVC